MNKQKIYDCITFYDENLLTNTRFEILNDVVDFFIVCESKYDHKGKVKPINFNLTNKKFKNKIRHQIIDDAISPKISVGRQKNIKEKKFFDSLKDARH